MKLSCVLQFLHKTLACVHRVLEGRPIIARALMVGVWTMEISRASEPKGDSRNAQQHAFCYAYTRAGASRATITC